MRALRILTAVTLLSVVAGAARADGLLYQLPKDGDWVGFDYQGNIERYGMFKGTLYMSSVGRTTEGEDNCRWIEISFRGTWTHHKILIPEKYVSLHKILIPEKYLKKGENPGEHIVRGWQKFGDRDAMEMQEGTFSTAMLSQLLPGPLEIAEKLDKKVVESKLGKLECEGLTGSTVFSWRRRQREAETQSTYHMRLHKKAPFGVVSARIHSETTIDGQPSRTETITLKLSDFGEDQESELPDHN